MGHSVSARNPTGGAGERRAPTPPALHHDLTARVVAPANLRRAWKQVKANRGSPGVDGMSIDHFQHRVRQLTGRSWGVSMDYRLGKLAQYLRGWMNDFGISNYYRPIPGIDPWIRRRIRMCYWKWWRKVRTKVRHLLALGTSRHQAILTALSRKAYWHLARTLATQTGMTNPWLERQGLISVRHLWLKAHG